MIMTNSNLGTRITIFMRKICYVFFHISKVCNTLVSLVLESTETDKQAILTISI